MAAALIHALCTSNKFLYEKGFLLCPDRLSALISFYSPESEILILKGSNNNVFNKLLHYSQHMKSYPIDLDS